MNSRSHWTTPSVSSWILRAARFARGSVVLSAAPISAAVPGPSLNACSGSISQRLLSEGSFVATYKYALLLSLADLAVERGDDVSEDLSLDTLDLAEKFVDLYWRQVLPWIPARGGAPQRLHQNTGREAAILRHLAEAHERWQGSLPRLRGDKRAWRALVGEVARVIEVMPLWKLQTVGRHRLDFLFPNVGRVKRFRLREEAVYCFRRFTDGPLPHGALSSHGGVRSRCAVPRAHRPARVRLTPAAILAT
jgi:hypothetical protein